MSFRYVNIRQNSSVMTPTGQYNWQSSEINMGGNGNHQTIKSGCPTVSVTGNDNSIQTEGSTGRIQICGDKNKATVGENSGRITLCGNDHEVIIQGNSGHIVVNGNDILVDIAGDVNSLTLTGNDNEIRIGGSCLDEIRLGTFEGGPKPRDTCRNLIKIGGTALSLNMGCTTHRNEIQCQWIETIEMNGTENRIKSNFGNLVDHGQLNVVGPEAVEDPAPVVPAPVLDDENVSHDDHARDEEKMAENNDAGDDEIHSIYITD